MYIKLDIKAWSPWMHFRLPFQIKMKIQRTPPPPTRPLCQRNKMQKKHNKFENKFGGSGVIPPPPVITPRRSNPVEMVEQNGVPSRDMSKYW